MSNNKLRPRRIIIKNNKYFIFKNGRLLQVTKDEIETLKKEGYQTNKLVPKITKKKAVKTFSKRVTNSNQVNKLADIRTQLAELYLKLIKEPESKKRAEEIAKVKKEQEETKKYIEEQFKKTNDLLTGKLKQLPSSNLVQGEDLKKDEIEKIVFESKDIQTEDVKPNENEVTYDFNDKSYIVPKEVFNEYQESLNKKKELESKIIKEEQKTKEKEQEIKDKEQKIKESRNNSINIAFEKIRDNIQKDTKTNKFRINNELLTSLEQLTGNSDSIRATYGSNKNFTLFDKKTELLDALYKLVDKSDDKKIELFNQRYGKGVKEHKGKGIAIYQIEEVMKGLPYFLGVLTLNDVSIKLEEVKKNNQPIFSFIYFYENYLNNNINHYTAVFCDMTNYKEICYYDSYGYRIPEKLYEKLKKFIEKLELPFMLKFKENYLKNQSDTSDTCGLFSLWYIYQRYFGFSHKEACNYDNIEENEKRMLKASVNFGFV